MSSDDNGVICFLGFCMDLILPSGYIMCLNMLNGRGVSCLQVPSMRISFSRFQKDATVMLGISGSFSP